MAVINLRDYYSWYADDEFADVPDEVARELEESRRLERNYRRRVFYNRAFYSLDAGDGIESEAIVFYNMSPCAAVSDSIDTFIGDNEIMPFKSVVNEYYARDISRKIRAAYRTKALNGEFTGPYAPYGYRKHPENKHLLIVGENTAGVVRRIFQMATEGLNPNRIAAQLSKERIPTPRAYAAELYNKYKYPKRPFDWNNTTILTVLRNREYLGHLVCNRSTTKSFKNKKVVQLPKDQWIETPNTHAPIVDQYIFDLAQKVVGVKKRENTTGRSNIFVGLLKCSDCSGSLGFIKGKTEGHQGAYNCNLYRKWSSKYCTAHYITHKALYQLVLNDIRRNAAIAGQYESELSAYVQKITGVNFEEKNTRLRRELDKLKQRYNELDVIIKKLFEQSAFGVISDERFVSMSADYEQEQKGLSEKAAEIQKQLVKRDTNNSDATKFHNVVRKYSKISELSAGILNDLIDSIVVYDAEGKGVKKNRIQRVEINYRFVGQVQLSEEGLT